MAGKQNNKSGLIKQNIKTDVNKEACSGNEHPSEFTGLKSSLYKITKL